LKQRSDQDLANRAVGSLVLGLVSIFGLLVPIQLPAAVVGLLLGIQSRRSSNRKLALAGICVSSIGLLMMLVVSCLVWDVVRHVGVQRALQEYLSN
jgi:hypothetical protein